MEISFTNAKLASICNSAKKLRGKYGPRMASLIQQRLLEISASENLALLRTLPGPRCHALTADKKGLLAVDLVHPDRLVFYPDHDPVPLDDDGKLIWADVTEIVIAGIGDYHKKRKA